MSKTYIVFTIPSTLTVINLAHAEPGPKYVRDYDKLETRTLEQDRISSIRAPCPFDENDFATPDCPRLYEAYLHAGPDGIPLEPITFVELLASEVPSLKEAYEIAAAFKNTPAEPVEEDTIAEKVKAWADDTGEMRTMLGQAYEEIAKPDTYCGTPRLSNLQGIRDVVAGFESTSDRHGHMERFLKMCKDVTLKRIKDITSIAEENP